MRRVWMAAALVAGVALACGDFLETQPGAVDPIDAGDAGTDATAIGDSAPTDLDAAPDACDCTTKQLVADAGGEPHALAVDGTTLYYALYTPGGFFEIPKTGLGSAAAPTQILSTGNLQQGNDIAVDDSHVYLAQWLGTPGVQRASLDNTKQNTLLACGSSFGLALSTANVFATSSCGSTTEVKLYRFEKAQPTFAVVSGADTFGDASDPNYAYSTFGYVAVEGTFVYWSNVHQILRLPTQFAPDAGAEVIATVGDSYIMNFAVDDRFYVRTSHGVRAYDKGGSNARADLATIGFQDNTGYGRFALAIDATYVYFASVAGSFDVLRVPRVGGAQPTVLASPTSPCVAMTVDQNFLYYATKSGEIWRIPK
jgi:hypothetical protein